MYPPAAKRKSGPGIERDAQAEFESALPGEADHFHKIAIPPIVVQIG
jgi:hypothetical protein